MRGRMEATMKIDWKGLGLVIIYSPILFIFAMIMSILSYLPMQNPKGTDAHNSAWSNWNEV